MSKICCPFCHCARQAYFSQGPEEAFVVFSSVKMGDAQCILAVFPLYGATYSVLVCIVRALGPASYYIHVLYLYNTSTILYCTVFRTTLR